MPPYSVIPMLLPRAIGISTPAMKFLGKRGRETDGETGPASGDCGRERARALEAEHTRQRLVASGKRDHGVGSVALPVNTTCLGVCLQYTTHAQPKTSFAVQKENGTSCMSSMQSAMRSRLTRE